MPHQRPPAADTNPTPADLTRNPMAGIAITVDGPTASGKGSLARTLAKTYRMKLLDTGAIYRAVAWQMAYNGHDWKDTELAAQTAENLDFDFRHKGNNVFGVWVGGHEVTEDIRSLEIGVASSIVAIQPRVRAALKDFQVSYAQKWKPLVGVILDGRDTGARICPEAEVKLFLTAEVVERGRRRWLEMQAKGDATPLETVISQVAARDERDKENTILCRDATLIDNTAMTPDDVLAAAIKAIRAKTGRR
jgi:cytidylate kinase